MVIKSLEEIKVSVKQTEEKVDKLQHVNLPHISTSFAELGYNALKTLKDANLLTKFDPTGSTLPAIMTKDDMRAMQLLNNEYESNCYVQCKLITVFGEIELSVVNSERVDWLPTLSGVKNFNRKPDMIICNPCFYEATAPPSDNDGILAVKHQLLGDGALLYGIKAGRPELFLNDISILEGKYDAYGNDDVGQVKTYAGLQARELGNPAFHRIALFDRKKFVLFLSRGGEFVRATECDWDAPGSKELMQEFFNAPSTLVKALKASCAGLSVTPCVPEVNSPCILGAGGSGVVFRVTCKPADPAADATGRLGSTRSETAALQTKALKVVVDKDPYELLREWETAKRAGLISDRVVAVGEFFNGDDFGAYLMDEVGTTVDTSLIENKRGLFAALLDLHINRVVHGDARIQNAISAADGSIKWIDFASALVSTEVPVPVAKDFRLLYESLHSFAQTPSAAQVTAYEQCVEAQEISDEAWAALGVL